MSDRVLYPCGCASQGDQDWPCAAHAPMREPRDLETLLMQDRNHAVERQAVLETRVAELEAALSAIRALVQQWKEQIVELKALLVSTGSADAYLYARRRSEMETLQMVVGDLAALCPAPEDQP